jgi:hypothetical protein
MPLPNGFHATGPIIDLRFSRRGNDLRGAFGICRGLALGAALWAIVAVVAVSVGTTGDARDAPVPPTPVSSSPVGPSPIAPSVVAPAAVAPHTTITIDRGGRTYDR